MKAAWFYGGHDIRVAEAPNPEPGLNEAVVRVKAAGICGSDLHGYRDPGRIWKGLGMPYMTGHELAGEVAAVGAGVTNVRVGDRVAVEPRHLVGCGHCPYCRRGDYQLCRELGSIAGKKVYSTGFAEYSLESADKLYPLAAEVPFEEASILDVYACAVHALHLTPVNLLCNVVVQGAGPIGLTAVEIFKLGGAGQVIVCDVLDSSLELARKIGADRVVNSAQVDAVSAVRDLTNGYGADLVIDAVGGTAPIFGTNIKLAAPGGTVLVIGMYSGSQAVDSFEAHLKEVSLRWSWSYGLWEGVSEFKVCLDLLAAGRLEAKDYITHTFPLDRIGEGFATADRKRETGAIKVVIKP